MALGQFMALPQYYGTEFGRAYAHVFWIGFLLFSGAITAWFIRYIAHHKNPKIVDAGRYQLIGTIGVTGAVGIFTIAAIIMGNDTLTQYDGDVRKGVFVVWVLLLLIFTTLNISVLVFRRQTVVKRF